RGKSIAVENHGGLLVAANNVFPRGSSSIELVGVTRSNVAGNRLHSFYPGMVVLEDCTETLVASNHFLRDHEPWAPFQGVDNGLDDSSVSCASAAPGTRSSGTTSRRSWTPGSSGRAESAR